MTIAESDWFTTPLTDRLQYDMPDKSDTLYVKLTMFDTIQTVLFPGEPSRTREAVASTFRYLELPPAYIFVYAELPAESLAQPK